MILLNTLQKELVFLQDIVRCISNPVERAQFKDSLQQLPHALYLDEN